MSPGSQNETKLSFETDIISQEQRHFFNLVNNVVLSGLMGVAGSIANVINMAVFYKQGLNTTINIGFFAMAVSDLCSLIFHLWYIISGIPYLERLNLPLVLTDVQYIIGGISRELFARSTCLITAYVTAERCLCIAFPLHVKQMITPERTMAIIIFLFSVTWIYAAPLFVVGYLDWQLYPEKNRTLLGSVIASNKDEVEGVVFITHAVFGVVSLVAVVTFTLILIRKLSQTSAWRRSVKSHHDKSDSMSKRDRATMSMVVLIASILIICYVPSVALSVTTFCEPEFAVSGKYFNLYYILWSFALLFETINSSINIVFYYKMSTNFRHIFGELFTHCQSRPKMIKQ